MSNEVRFGFKGLDEFIRGAIEVGERKETTETMAGSKATAGLLSILRTDVEAEGYVPKYLNDDINLIDLLLKEEEEPNPSELYDYISADTQLNTQVFRVVDAVMGIYRYFLQDGLGLHPYEGVLSLKRRGCVKIGKDNRITSVKGGSGVFNLLATALLDKYKVDERADRQFNVKDIIKAQKVCYYPNKLLEYASGRWLTHRLAQGVYREHALSIDWDKYAKEYVQPQIERLVKDAVYASIVEHYTGKVEEEWRKNKAKVKQQIADANFNNLITQDLIFIQKSLCCGVCVTKYEHTGNQVNSIKIRIVDVDETLNAGMTRQLLSGGSTNAKVEYRDAVLVSEGRQTPSGQTLPYAIYEFGHEFDEQRANAVPLWGYKAIQLFQKKGWTLSWDKILLGEDIKGTSLFTESGKGKDEVSTDSLTMQEAPIHSIVAGSRCGKGLMTMNLLACAIASNKAIFYIDRKPDMATMFYELTGGNMFIVNGRQRTDADDPNGCFIPERGMALGGFVEAWQATPSYVQEMFGDGSYYGSAVGDWVYWRALMLVFGIVYARVMFKGTDIYNSLGGDNGFVVVVDEFSNWQENGEKELFGVQDGIFPKHSVTAGDEGRYKKAEDAIKSAQFDLERAKTDKETDKAEKTLATAQHDMQDIMTPQKLYCRQLLDKYAESMTALKTIVHASFNDEKYLVDFFVISQLIDCLPYGGSGTSIYPRQRSGGFAFNKRDDGKDLDGVSLVRGLFDEFGHDWFFGANEGKAYFGFEANGKRQVDTLLTRKRSYWAYVKNASLESLQTKTPSSYTLFKPYLVLNDNVEPEVYKDGVVEGRFVNQCQDRINKATPGVDTWSLHKPSIMDDEITDRIEKGELSEAQASEIKHRLHPGIGFKGLAEQISGGGGDWLDVLRKSKDIADWVANRLGYPDYQAFLYDFSPRGIFSVKDIANGLQNPEAWNDLRTRLDYIASHGGEDMLSGAGELGYEPMGFDGEEETSAYRSPFQGEGASFAGQGADFNVYNDEAEDGEQSEQATGSQYDGGAYRERTREDYERLLRAAVVLCQKQIPEFYIPESVLQNIVDQTYRVYKG